MCNVIDGPCEFAGKYPNNLYHNKPTLYYQIHGELIHLHSATRELTKAEDPDYGYKIAAIRKTTTNKIIAICDKMAKNPTASEKLL